MVAYATPDEVRAAVVRDLNKLSQSTASMSDTQIQANIDNAQAQVDSKMRRLYAVPFEPVPAMIKAIVIDIAGYLSTANYRQERQIPEVDPIVRRYNRAMDQLCHLAEGYYALEGADGALMRRMNGIGRPINPSNQGRLFPPQQFGIWSR
jgi:phage gp36-like protein